MGGRQSKVVEPQAPAKDGEGGFSVSVTPGLVQSLEASAAGAGQGPPGKPEVVTTKEEAEEISAAYRKGIKDAENQLRHHLVLQKEDFTKEIVNMEKRGSEELQEKVNEFRARKFAPPQRPVACEEQGAELVKCYKEKKSSGDLGGPLACRTFVDAYEECARKVVQGIDVTKTQ